MASIALAPAAPCRHAVSSVRGGPVVNRGDVVVRDDGPVSGLISSASNPVVKRLRRLADAKHRRREGAFVVEGIAPVWQAVEAGASIEELIVAPDLLGDSPAMAMVAEQAAEGIRVAHLSAELFTRLSDRDGPSGLAAVVRMGVRDLADLPVARDGFLVAAHETANPGNLGTIVRTAEAFGAGGLVLSGSSADPYSPQAVKASMGSLFHLPIARVSDLDEVFDWAAANGIATLTTSARAETPLDHVTLRPPVLVILGPERTGLADDDLARGDHVVTIPIVGRATSLNLAVAAGILMHEMHRQLG
jgi:RNA methyltransferase, TrmH family